MQEEQDDNLLSRKSPAAIINACPDRLFTLLVIWGWMKWSSMRLKGLGFKTNTISKFLFIVTGQYHRLQGNYRVSLLALNEVQNGGKNHKGKVGVDNDFVHIWKTVSKDYPCMVQHFHCQDCSPFLLGVNWFSRIIYQTSIMFSKCPGKY